MEDNTDATASAVGFFILICYEIMFTFLTSTACMCKQIQIYLENSLHP